SRRRDRENSIRAFYLLSVEWSRAVQRTQQTGSAGDRRYWWLGRIDAPPRVLPHGDLLSYTFQQDEKFFRFMLSLGLPTHLLDFLRSTADSIGHGGCPQVSISS